MTIEFSSTMGISLVRHMAADEFVVQAAQVSAKGSNDLKDLIRRYEKGHLNVNRFIRALMAGRHGSPFEHTAFTFFVEVPIFVVREWQRHRISSFNEMSGRYTELPGKFYVPSQERVVVNSGTKMKPSFVISDDGVRNDAWAAVYQSLTETSFETWRLYQNLLDAGIANEVARMVLPVNIYTQMMWTVNARSLMNFLSLRVQSDDSLYRSYPQWEIDVAARLIENIFAEIMPETHSAFVDNGRVAP